MCHVIYRLFLVVALVCCGSVVAVAATAPTLTSVNTLTGATEDQPFVITHAMLEAAAIGFSDADGDALRFRIENITSGTLVMRNAPPASPGTPSSVTPGTVLASGKELVWTPVQNAFNAQLAFTVRAWDNTLASSAEVQVTMQVTAVPDLPALTNIATLNIGIEDTRTILTRVAILPVSDASDVDGTTVNFKVMTVLSGNLGVRNINSTAVPTPVEVGTTILTTLNELVWDPPANFNGLSSVCTLVAHSTDGQSSSGVALRVQVAAVNDPILVFPLPASVDYNLKLSGFAQIFSDSLTITDQDGQPMLKTAPSDYLKITAGVSVNRVANEDSMELRSTEKCKLVRRGANFEIRWLSSSGTLLADVTTADDGSLIIDAKDGAQTVANSGTPPVGSAAVVAELLKTINYTNQAGRFATITTQTTRQIKIEVIEGHPDSMLGGKTPVTLTSVITLLRDNDPPKIIPFDTLVVSPGGIGRIVFPVDQSGNVPDFDPQQTANQNLTISVNSIPNGGEVIDLVTNQIITTSFSGSRLMPASTAGIGYRNKVPDFASDSFTLRVVDAGNLGTISNVVVRIDSNATGEARFVSDPLLVMDRGTSKVHQVTIVGPTLTDVVLGVTKINGQVLSPSPLTWPAGVLKTDANGSAQTTLTINAPATGAYLEFMLTCTIGGTTAKQPYLIRLTPVVPFAASN